MNKYLFILGQMSRLPTTLHCVCVRVCIFPAEKQIKWLLIAGPQSLTDQTDSRLKDSVDIVLLFESTGQCLSLLNTDEEFTKYNKVKTFAQKFSPKSMDLCVEVV